MKPYANMFWTVSIALAYLLVSFVSAQSKCGVPDAVNNLKAEKTTNTTTHLSWQPPASTECLDHYKITYCSYLGDKCSNKTVVLSLNTTQYDVTGLKPCTSNVIHVYAVGKDGRETNTDEDLYTGSGNPPKVQSVKFNYVGAINITVDWERPSGYSDECYPGYKVCYSAKGDNKETCSYAVKDEFTTLSAVPLSPCTEYNFSVATVDGNFAADSKTSAKTYASVVTAPQMPNVTVTVHNHTAHATWKTPDTLSMTCAASYVVNNSRLTGRPYHEVLTTVSSQTIPLNANEATITGLDSCTNNQIFFHLVGHNGHSSSIEVVVQDPDSDIPTPTGVNVWTVATNFLMLYYDKGLNDCMNSFRVCWFTGKDAETCQFTPLKSSMGSFRHIGLKPCANYTVHVTAVGSTGKYSENFTAIVPTGPKPLSKVEVHKNTTAVNLSWVNPTNNPQCTKYIKVEITRDKDDKVTTVKLPSNATTTTLADLSPCSTYSLEATPVGIDGRSSSIYISQFTTSCKDTMSLS